MNACYTDPLVISLLTWPKIGNFILYFPFQNIKLEKVE